MQLGGGHVSSTLSHAAEWAAEAEVETSNPWGNDDLMDVNADQDDWSKMTPLPRGPTNAELWIQVLSKPRLSWDMRLMTNDL